MKNIAVISGGYSSEVIVSVKSAKTVFNHIDKSKYNCFEISITKDSWYVLINDAKSCLYCKSSKTASSKKQHL